MEISKFSFSDILRDVPVSRLIMVIVGAAFILMGSLYVVSTSQTPTKQILYSGLDSSEVPRILEVLETKNIDYLLQGVDTVLIPARDVAAIKMELAAKGLPRGGHRGYDVVSKSENLYGKTEMEQYVLYKQAYEQELESAISSLDAVQFVRVLLALPQSNRLLKSKGLVKASITLSTWGGETLTPNQVKGIVKLVVDSVPDLSPENVSVVDQYGALLNIVTSESGVDSERIEYVRQIELERTKKALSLVESFVGLGNVKVVVTADVDFTHREVRLDNYDNLNPAIRSQHLSSANIPADMTVPGSLSNQPPAAGRTPESTVLSELSVASSGTSESLTNYELGKESIYELAGKGRLNRLIVSVVVNHKVVADGVGGVAYQPRTVEEIEKIKLLVSAGVGAVSSRGDEVYVSSEQFSKPVDYISAGESVVSLWNQPWFGDAVNQGLGILFVIIVFYLFMRPILRNSARSIEVDRASKIAIAQERELADVESRRRVFESQRNESTEEKFTRQRSEVHTILSEDPKVTSQILKHWMAKS